MGAALLVGIILGAIEGNEEADGIVDGTVDGSDDKLGAAVVVGGALGASELTVVGGLDMLRVGCVDGAGEKDVGLALGGSELIDGELDEMGVGTEDGAEDLVGVPVRFSELIDGGLL